MRMIRKPRNPKPKESVRWCEASQYIGNLSFPHRLCVKCLLVVFVAPRDNAMSCPKCSGYEGEEIIGKPTSKLLKNKETGFMQEVERRTKISTLIGDAVTTRKNETKTKEK